MTDCREREGDCSGWVSSLTCAPCYVETGKRRAFFRFRFQLDKEQRYNPFYVQLDGGEIKLLYFATLFCIRLDRGVMPVEQTWKVILIVQGILCITTL